MVADGRVVRHLIKTQFPEYADLDMVPVSSGGTDHTLFRLGQDLSVRLPKREDAVAQGEKEHVWLPRLAVESVRIPTPVARGQADEKVPFAWSIYDWCPGQALIHAKSLDFAEIAQTLARFTLELQSISTRDAPLAGQQNHFRGVALIKRHQATIAAITGVSDEYPEAALRAVWEQAISAPSHAQAAVWLHGDLQGGNLLVREGHLSAIIDFGLSGVGDPACDLMVAWSVLPKDCRAAFRDQLNCDDARWARGRGWALSVATIALDYYRGRNPQLCAISRQTLDAVLEGE